MAEGSATAFLRKIVTKTEPYLPQVPKPTKKLSLQKRLLWCGGILLIYMIMGQTPLFGATTPEFDFLAFARVIFASQQGTLVELGIGPIVTAGLLMQLLRGSDILKFDFKKPEERGVFQTATKLVTYVVIIAESAVYGIAVYGPGMADPSHLYVLIGQLMGASIIIMFLDETVQKGWGLGSGISLFIMAGVAQQILWSMFSPLPAGDGFSIGIFPFIGESAMAGDLGNVLLWANVNPQNNNAFMNILAQFDPTSPSTPIGGLIYYITPPRGLDVVALDPLRAVGYVIFMIAIVIVFGRLWVELGGLSPKSAAKNLLDADVQVPGFRRSNEPIEVLLNKYIPSVTIIGSAILGLLAGVSDVLGVFGSGIGILLMVDILINYYNQLIKEQVEVVMPRLGALLGRK